MYLDSIVLTVGLSIRKACATLRLSRTVFAYQPSPRDDMPLIKALLGLAEKYPRYGFTKYFILLRRAGHRWNHKRVYRVYRKMNLHLRRKGKRRLPSRALVRLEAQANKINVGLWIL